MGKQIDQAGEVFLKDGVRYAPGNVPCNTMALHRGKHMADVSLVHKRGSVVEVTQYVRDEQGAFHTEGGLVVRRIVIVEAKQFKLKYGVERKRTAESERDATTMRALIHTEKRQLS